MLKRKMHVSKVKHSLGPALTTHGLFFTYMLWESVLGAAHKDF